MGADPYVLFAPPGASDLPLGDLAGPLGCSAYDLRLRLRDDIPALLATDLDEQLARDLAARVRRGGSYLLACRQIPLFRPFDVQRRVQPRIDDGALVLQRDDGQRIACGEIQLVVYSRTTSRRVETETQTQKKLSMARTLAAGGLPMHKKTEVRTERWDGVAEVERFYVFAGRSVEPAGELACEQIDFAVLGDERDVSLTANIQKLRALLQSRCAEAQHDDRLFAPGATTVTGRYAGLYKAAGVPVVLARQLRMLQLSGWYAAGAHQRA